MQSAFRALADPSRREIISLLRGGSRTSGEIAQHFSTSWATISRHLAVLREAELILSEREGQFIRYELNTTVFHDLIHHLLGMANRQGPVDDNFAAVGEDTLSNERPKPPDDRECEPGNLREL